MESKHLSISYCFSFQPAKNLLFLAVLFFSPYWSFAQQNNVEKADQLLVLANKNMLKPDSMIRFAEEAYGVSLKSNYKKGEAMALKFKGIYAHRKSNFDEAIEFYKQGLAIVERLKDSTEMGKAYGNIATSASAKHDYVTSIAYGTKALRLFEETKNEIGRGRILNLLGIVSSVQKDYKTALNYFLEYNRLAVKANDTVEMASSYNNIGSTYNELKNPRFAIQYYQKAIPLHEKKGNINGLGKTYENVGTLFYERKDYKNALINHQKSKAAYEQVGDRKFLSHSLYHIGIVYKNTGDTTKALDWLNRARSLASEVQEQEIVQQANASIADLEARTDHYKSAYETLKLSVSAKDSMMTSDKVKIIEDLKTKYETEKKEQQIKNLSQQSLIQKLQIKQRNTYLAVAIALLILAGILGYLIYNRRKLAEQARLQSEINKQQEIAARAVLTAEERERRRIATDLHDGVGQLLSAALMNLNGLFKKLTFDGTESQLADRSLALVTESYDEMRSISHQMMPNALLKAGLASAVKEFLDKIDSSQLRINLETGGLNDRLDEQTETVLYRVIQETVNNVIKHAKATKLDIQLVKDEDGISATIEDNGRGFDSSKIKGKEGIGLKNILSRVEFLKGTVDFDSSPGKGTLVAIHIPA
jgi:signal transduction histidine kinase